MGIVHEYDTVTYLLNRLRDEIYVYESRNGERPKVIMATARAYALIENYAKEFYVVNAKYCAIPYLFGIEIRAVSGSGYEVFLSGQPIALRE
ncbi:MAG: hypothetical protein E7438_03255 [Ruminococcaceae bacterium]|nr:hypothetical protein [Oscillospiraceae bacterium]